MFNHCENIKSYKQFIALTLLWWSFNLLDFWPFDFPKFLKIQALIENLKSLLTLKLFLNWILHKVLLVLKLEVEYIYVENLSIFFLQCRNIKLTRGVCSHQTNTFLFFFILFKQRCAFKFKDQILQANNWVVLNLVNNILILIFLTANLKTECLVYMKSKRLRDFKSS